MNKEKTKAEKLFNTVYEWGRNNVKTDYNCETFRKLLDDIIDESIYDFKRHGET